MRNAEYQGERRGANDFPLQFRIPHSALRIQLNALIPVISCPKMSVWMSCVPSYV